jgi:hypothetical protein
MSTVEALRDLEELGSAQWGLITTGQAARVGVNRVTLGRLSDKGALTRIRHGVYALPSADFGHLQDLRAAWLAIDSKRVSEERFDNPDDAVASHSSAAAVHGLGDGVSVRHEFTTPVRRQTAQPDLRFHRAQVAEDKVLVDGLPVTSVARTVADLAAAKADFDHFSTVVRDALDKTDLSVNELGQSLAPHSDQYGYESGSALIEACLEKAGIPNTASRMLSQYPNAVRNAMAPQFESMFKPLMENMFQKYLRPEWDAQQDALRSILRGMAIENLQLPSEFNTATGLNLVIDQLSSVTRQPKDILDEAVNAAIKGIESEDEPAENDTRTTAEDHDD